MATNGGTYGRCTSSIADTGNAYLIGVRNHGAEISLLILIEQESEIIVPHRSQPGNWYEKIFQIHIMVKF